MTDTPATPAPDDPSVGAGHDAAPPPGMPHDAAPPPEMPHDADPPPEMPRDADPAWDRLEDQIRWYDTNSAKNKQWFTSLKIVQLIGAAAVPVMASVHAAVWVTGGLGAVVVVVEGIQQLGQYQANWMNYRSTTEALNHEKFLYLSDAGHYHGVADPQRLLAERTEALISQEHSQWTSGREQAMHREHDQAGGRGQGRQ